MLMWILLGIGLGFVVLLAFQMTWQSDLPSAETDPHPRELDPARLEALPESTRQVRDLLAAAEEQIRAGRYDQAMIYYYSWQLVQLDRQSLVELQKGKTNRDYLRELQQAEPPQRNLFSQSTGLFEDVFFGHLPVPRTEFLSVWEQRALLQADSTRRPRP